MVSPLESVFVFLIVGHYNDRYCVVYKPKHITILHLD